MFASRHVRPMPLLDSSTEESDDMIPPRKHRVSFASLVNTHPPTRYHVLVMGFVCSVTFVQSLQLYLPVVLGLYLLLAWELPPSAISLLALSYPVSSFIAPLLQAVLARCSLRVRLSLTLTVAMLLLLGSVAWSEIRPLVALRCLAGVFSVPESLLTELWAHVYQPSWHPLCRRIISASHRTGLALSLLLILCNSFDFALGLGCAAGIFSIPIVLSWWITETPLMLIRQGRYSLIMKSIRTVFKGPTIDYLRLQELDLSDDLSRQPPNPVYMYSERVNRKNIALLYFYRVVQAGTLFSLLCSLPLFTVSSTGCLASTVHTSQPLDITTAGEILALALSALLAMDLVPYVKLKHEILVSGFFGALAFALMAACIFGKAANFAVLCFAVVSVTSFHSALRHLSSTISVSIAGECLGGLILTTSLFLARAVSDINAMTLFIVCSVLMCGVFVSGFLVEVPLTKELCHKMAEVEMDDPLETIEMELEVRREGDSWEEEEEG